MNRNEEQEQVAWSVCKFPVELRRCFICEARSQNMTVTRLLETIVEEFVQNPVEPEHIIIVDEGKFKLWNTGKFPLTLKNQFVGMALKWNLTVAELLQTIILEYVKKQEAKRKKQRIRDKKEQMERAGEA